MNIATAKYEIQVALGNNLPLLYCESRLKKIGIPNLRLEEPASKKRPSPCILEIFVHALFHAPTVQRRPFFGHAQCECPKRSRESCSQVDESFKFAS